MKVHTTTFAVLALATLVILAAIALPASADDAEVSAWSAYLEPVADVWSAGLGYNMRGRAQQVGLLEDEEVAADEDESGGRVFATRQHAGENGGGACDPLDTKVCSGHGWCTSDVCVCKTGWTAFQCNHERKSKTTAFLLEFFVGASTGASSFYLGYIGQGVGKLVMYWGGCLLVCLGSILAGAAAAGSCKSMASALGLLSFLGSVSFIAVSIWSVVDWIMILTDDLNDSDGYYLAGF